MSGDQKGTAQPPPCAPSHMNYTYLLFSPFLSLSTKSLKIPISDTKRFKGISKTEKKRKKFGI
ncbi:hypothetical protein QQP08_024325 [Theobroma cacao]|nr:hypothetical protein QQP08_024325 [Theobroma cacao]